MLPESSRVNRRFGRKVVPVVEPSGTFEMSVIPAKAGWAAMQALVRDAIRLARVNLCFTDRDRAGLESAVPQGRFASLVPFIDTAPYARGFTTTPGKDLMAVAMMRKGDKFASFTMLAKALALLLDLPWRLIVIGDGAARRETVEEFTLTVGVRRR